MSRAVFMVSGTNIEKFLSKAKYIQLFELSRNGEALYGKCLYKDLKRVKDLAAKEGLEFTPLMQTYRPLKYFFLTLFLTSVILTFFWANRVWTFVYKSNDEVLMDKVHNYLLENNVGPGERVGNFLPLSIQLKQAFPEISMIDFKKEGVRLNIDIIVKPKEQLNIPQEAVRAKLGGIVRYVNVYLGQAQVNAGDVVYKGQLLIQGEPLAAGKVIGETVVKIEQEVSLQESVLEPTGKKHKELLVKIGLKEWRFGFKPVGERKWHVKEQKFGWAGNRRQFVEITLIMYDELKEFTLTRTQEEALQMALNLAETKLSQLYGDSFILEKKSESIVTPSQVGVALLAKIETDLAKERLGE